MKICSYSNAPGILGEEIIFLPDYGTTRVRHMRDRYAERDNTKGKFKKNYRPKRKG